MKGILKSNIDNDWFVWYTNIENSSVYEKVLSLIRDFSNWVYYNPTDGLEVEFEIVNEYKITKECLCKDLSYEATKSCEHFTGAPINECLYIEQEKVKYAKLVEKQEDNSGWEEIYAEYIKNPKNELNCSNLIYWLKQHFETPKRKK